tara:strand:- start:769 stop:984 length:216 start_codon:yes stop_codon:yes gene_type:complete
MIVMLDTKIEIEKTPQAGVVKAYINGDWVGYFKKINSRANVWSFSQLALKEKMTADYYLAVLEKLNELNAK